MIQARRAIVVALGAVAVALVLFAGIYAHHALTTACSGDLSAKLTAENLLFLSIVGAAVVSLGVVFLLLRSRGMDRTLERVVELARLGSSAVEDTLLRLGKTGRQFREILRLLNDLSERRALKISAMSALVDLLLNNTQLPLVVADPTGKVTHASRGFLDAKETTRSGAVGRQLPDIVDELSFPALSARLVRERGMVEDEGNPDIRYLGVFNRAGDLAAVVCVFGSRQLYVSPVSQPAPQKRRRTAFGRFIDRRRQ